METERMRYETFISLAHGCVERGVGGADADSYDSFARLYFEMSQTKAPSEQLKKDFYIKLGEVRGVLDAAITVFRYRNFNDLSVEDRQALITLCNQLFESSGEDIIEIIDRGTQLIKNNL